MRRIGFGQMIPPRRFFHQEVFALETFFHGPPLDEFYRVLVSRNEMNFIEFLPFRSKKSKMVISTLS